MGTVRHFSTLCTEPGVLDKQWGENTYRENEPVVLDKQNMQRENECAESAVAVKSWINECAEHVVKDKLWNTRALSP